ncbi:uncharacterized protein At5g01610-like [Rutidosis leptorrhynchoides]|uniref:uncharacterized protein At5g01610-like n=1 Tax=Rutidosis leptorrhynchoides TaxID=125765 RepID=UPI003A98FC05
MNMYSNYNMFISLQFPLILLFFTSVVIAQLPTAELPTAYEVLQEYGFPVGLLPASVTSYTLNRETGQFLVTLGNKCGFSFDGYDVRFKSTISGVIKKDSLTNLKGVSAKVMWMWTDVLWARRHGDEVDFSVGMFSAGFDVQDFEESPQCGCGFDCEDDLEAKDDKLLDLSMLQTT